MTDSHDAQALEPTSVLFDKPYLTLGIEAESVAFEIYVNGGFVSTDISGMTANETWPVNQLLRDGSNELAVLVRPWPDDHGGRGTFEDAARVVLTLKVRPSGSQRDADQVIAKLMFVASQLPDARASQGSTEPGRMDSRRGFIAADRGDVIVRAATVRQLSREGEQLVTLPLVLPLPLPTPGYLLSDRERSRYERPEEDEMIDLHDELLSQYEVVWKALQARDLHKLMPMFEERSRETDLAFYRPLGTTQKRLRQAFEESFRDSDQVLAPLRKKKGYWTVEVAPGGQQLRLVGGPRSAPIIRYFDKNDHGSVTEFPIAFRRQDGRYVVSR